MDSRQLKPLFHHFTVSFYPTTVIHYLLDITRCKTNIHHQVSPTIEGLARYPWDVWHIFIFAGQLGCWQCTGWCSSVHSVGLSASRPWKPLRTIENDVLISGRPRDRYSQKGWGCFHKRNLSFRMWTFFKLVTALLDDKTHFHRQTIWKTEDWTIQTDQWCFLYI